MSTPDLNPLFQVGLDVRGRTCLVIGGGGEAEDKAGRLLEAGARLIVVSPRVGEGLRSWHAEGRLELRERAYEPQDLDGVFLVMNTTRSDADLVAAVFSACESRGILVNSYDDVEHSHFGMAALVSAGPLRISISTSNASPTLASRLRKDLGALFGEEFGSYLLALAEARAHVKGSIPTFEERRQLLRSLVDGFELDASLRLPPGWRQRVQAILETGSAS